MLGTVSEVSATLVASTTRRCAPVLNILSCSSADNRANSANTSILWGWLLQGFRRVAYLALAGQEHQHIAAQAACRQFIQRRTHRLRHILRTRKGYAGGC